MSVSNVISSRTFVREDSSTYSMEFISAEYLDADNDGNADDTRFFVDVFFSENIFDGSRVKLDCDFEIILPSNTTYYYTGFIHLGATSCVIQFDCYDTVTEPGWYTINFHSSVRQRMNVYYSFCTIIFDPPTGHGEGGGSPSISI
jgi:hypothetical protein